jgi:hypothetical protein
VPSRESEVVGKARRVGAFGTKRFSRDMCGGRTVYALRVRLRVLEERSLTGSLYTSRK